MYRVKKRTGDLIGFDISKISEAITQAFESQDKHYNQNITLLKP